MRSNVYFRNMYMLCTWWWYRCFLLVLLLSVRVGCGAHACGYAMPAGSKDCMNHTFYYRLRRLFLANSFNDFVSKPSWWVFFCFLFNQKKYIKFYAQTLLLFQKLFFFLYFIILLMLYPPIELMFNFSLSNYFCVVSGRCSTCACN